MTLKLDLPEEVIEALGSKPEREVLEGVLLLLVSEGKITLGRAGEILGLDRLSVVRWYTGHGMAYPDPEEGYWFEANAQSMAEHLAVLESEVSSEELQEWVQTFETAFKPLERA